MKLIIIVTMVANVIISNLIDKSLNDIENLTGRIFTNFNV